MVIFRRIAYIGQAVPGEQSAPATAVTSLVPGFSALKARSVTPRTEVAAGCGIGTRTSALLLWTLAQSVFPGVAWRISWTVWPARIVPTWSRSVSVTSKPTGFPEGEGEVAPVPEDPAEPHATVATNASAGKNAFIY